MIVNQEEREVMTRVVSVPCREHPRGHGKVVLLIERGAFLQQMCSVFFLVADVYLRKDLFIDNNKDHKSTHYSNSYRLSGITFFLKNLLHNDKTLA